MDVLESMVDTMKEGMDALAGNVTSLMYPETDSDEGSVVGLLQEVKDLKTKVESMEVRIDAISTNVAEFM